MLTFTDRAREMIRSFMEQSEGELGALRISMDGSPLAPRFELTLVQEAERKAEERSFDSGDFTVLIAEAQVERLEGATVDFIEHAHESGFEVRPRPGALEPTPSATSTGPMAEKVTQLLNDEVNPAIAAHGGVITLVDVKDTEIYLEMSGGCQGCAMSRLTLRQGVERMLRQAIPEITAVHDATDHEEGSSPYYQQPV